MKYEECLGCGTGFVTCLVQPIIQGNTLEPANCMNFQEKKDVSFGKHFGP